MGRLTTETALLYQQALAIKTKSIFKAAVSKSPKDSCEPF